MDYFGVLFRRPLWRQMFPDDPIAGRGADKCAACRKHGGGRWARKGADRPDRPRPIPINFRAERHIHLAA